MGQGAAKKPAGAPSAKKKSHRKMRLDSAWALRGAGETSPGAPFHLNGGFCNVPIPPGDMYAEMDRLQREMHQAMDLSRTNHPSLRARWFAELKRSKASDTRRTLLADLSH